MGQQEVLEFLKNSKTEDFWCIDSLAKYITCCTQANVGRSCTILHKAGFLERIQIRHRGCIAAAYRLKKENKTEMFTSYEEFLEKVLPKEYEKYVKEQKERTPLYKRIDKNV